MDIDRVLGRSRVIPVISVTDAADAVPLVKALERGGIPIAEITLRTQAGLEAIRRVSEECPDVVVGAGTVLSVSDLKAATAAGAAFAVSPGSTPELLSAGQDSAIPLLPGIFTASELMVAMDRGYRAVKFFPAVPCGGPAAIREIGKPFPSVKFCPTGGMTLDLISSYLALPNVPCVGGIWMLPPDAVKAHDWERIETLAKLTVALVSTL